MACQVYRKNKLVHQIYFIIQKFQNLWPKCSKKVPKVFRPVFLCFYTWIFWNGFTKFWKKLSDVLPILCPSHLCVVICSVIHCHWLNHMSTLNWHISLFISVYWPHPWPHLFLAWPLKWSFLRPCMLEA